MWYVYIARGSDNTLYTGITTDPVRRQDEHNGKGGKGAKSLRSKRPVRIIYTEIHKTRSDASKREYEIKQKSREEKLTLIPGS